MQDKKILKETKFCTMYPRAPIYFLLLRGDDKFLMCFGLCCSHQIDIKFSMCSHLVNKLWVSKKVFFLFFYFLDYYFNIDNLLA